MLTGNLRTEFWIAWFQSSILYFQYLDRFYSQNWTHQHYTLHLSQKDMHKEI